MNIKEAKQCRECGGNGVQSTDYIDKDHNIQRGAGDDVKCENCQGSGVEPNDSIVLERILNDLSDEQEEKLQVYFMENDGEGYVKDQIESAFEGWLENLELNEIEKIFQ